MLNPVAGWFKITQYGDKHVITIENLVKAMFLRRYIWPTEIAYDQVSEFIGNYFKTYLIFEEYVINANTNSSSNPTSDVTLEIIHLIIDKQVCTYNAQEQYVYKDGPWMGILSAAEFSI